MNIMYSHLKLETVVFGAGKWDQQVKELTTKSDDLSLIPVIHLMEGDN